jgi:hypothetical protein
LTFLKSANSAPTLDQLLQNAQTVVLNFPVVSLLNAPGSIHVNLGWPHVSVATLRKSCE